MDILDQSQIQYRRQTFEGLTRPFLAAQQRIEHRPDYPGRVGWLVESCGRKETAV
jgi:hypothetical protein